MRKVLLPSLIILATSLLVVRIFYLQIVDDTLKLKSENNAIKKKYDYPERGYIYDRRAIGCQSSFYDIMVIPREVKNTDTLEFCQLLNITRRFYKKKKKAVYSPRLPSVFFTSIE
jgi:penicillin-binding protein 2